MKIGIAGLLHESNSFMPATTTRQQFVQSALDVGEAIIDRWSDAHHEIGGFLEGARCLDFTAVPLVSAVAMPSGPLTAASFDALVGEILEQVGAAVADGIDGLLLALHGAAVAVNHRDCDGEIVTRIRQLVGPELPVVMTLDLHANVSQRMIAGTTATVSYRSNPHLDQRQRGFEAADILLRTLRSEIRPVQALETPPMLIKNARQYTSEEPAVSLYRDLEEVIRRPGIISASVNMGYNHADVEEMGPSFLAVADADEHEARAAARWMARRAWERRADFVGDLTSPTDAVRQATAQGEYPTVLMDVGDNVGGGSPGDSTVLLEEIIRQRAPDALVVLHDPVAVGECVAAGVRSDIEIRVGARSADRHGHPVRLRGRVRTLSDGCFIEAKARHGGARFNDQGVTAVIDTDDNHTIVLTTFRMAPFSLQQILGLGIDARGKKIIVVKGVVAPRAAYEPIAASIVLVDTPGVTSTNLSHFDYRHRRRPLYPLESDAEYVTPA